LFVAQDQPQDQDQPHIDQPTAPPAKPRASRATGAKTKTAKPGQAAQTDTAMGERPAQRMPPTAPSDEATAAQLKLATAQGAAYAKALAAMDKESGAQTQRAGDYEISVVAERAEGMYHANNGQLRWMEPEHDNVHFEVAVRDAADGRFIPGLTVHIHVDKVDGAHVGFGELPFIWHPWLYHYGQNWWVPEAGDYRVRVRVEPPNWHRHDKTNGLRYAEPVEVVFTVNVQPGQKLAG
jgi:uncharacterized protein involved in high-affinity Fe2+ transport